MLFTIDKIDENDTFLQVGKVVRLEYANKKVISKDFSDRISMEEAMQFHMEGHWT